MATEITEATPELNSRRPGEIEEVAKRTRKQVLVMEHLKRAKLDQNQRQLSLSLEEAAEIVNVVKVLNKMSWYLHAGI